METIVAHWQDVTWTDAGSSLQSKSSQLFTILRDSSKRYTMRERACFIVTCMATLASLTSSCTAVTWKVPQKKRGFFLFCWAKSALCSISAPQGLESKSLRSRQQESQFLKSSKTALWSTLWRVLSAGWTLDLTLAATLPLICLSQWVAICAELYWSRTT